MEQLKALEILIQGVNKAQAKGVYNLDEAAIIAEAIRAFIKPELRNQDTVQNSFQNSSPTELPKFGHEEHQRKDIQYDGDVRKDIDEITKTPISLTENE